MMYRVYSVTDDPHTYAGKKIILSRVLERDIEGKVIAGFPLTISSSDAEFTNLEVGQHVQIYISFSTEKQPIS